MNCRKCQKLESAYIDGYIDAGDRRDFESHLIVCDACRKHVAQTRQLVSSLQTFSGKSMPINVWPAVSEQIKELEQARRTVRPRLALRLISILAFAGITALLALQFTGSGLHHTAPNLQRQDKEYIQYVQAYSQFQSEQSLDSDSMRVISELSREKAWPGR